MKKTIRIILSALLLGVAAVFFCNWWISHSTEKALYDSIEAVPHRHVALVLGTSPIGRNGGPNMYFYSRIDACTALYEAGKVDRILVSQRFHNERAVFIAMQKGIDAIGLNAADVNRHYGFLTRVREYFVRCKVFLDIILGVKPHFLGEPVVID